MLGAYRVCYTRTINSLPELSLFCRRYSLDIDLPDFVFEHPLIQALNQGANDLVTWSNVCSLVELIQGLSSEFAYCYF